jgi:hypothetical protein
LGALRQKSDPNFKEPDTQIHLTDLTSLKAKRKYVLPTTWPEFILLFTRLLKGYICNGYGNLAKGLFEYLEGLSVLQSVGSCSVRALIEYDDRVRSQSITPFDWLVFNFRLFEVVKAEFPVQAKYGGESSGQFAAGRAARKFNNGNKPYSRGERTKHGLCRGWAFRGKCAFAGSQAGCRFAHWCTHDKCVAANKTDHKPEQCPNKDE